MIHERSYADPRVLLPPVSSTYIRDISSVKEASKFDIGTAWIKGRVSLEYRMGRL